MTTAAEGIACVVTAADVPLPPPLDDVARSALADAVYTSRSRHVPLLPSTLLQHAGSGDAATSVPPCTWAGFSEAATASLASARTHPQRLLNVIAAAVLRCGDDYRASHSLVRSSVALGLEVAYRLHAVLGSVADERGLDTAPMTSRVGAAAGCARRLRTTPEQAVWALGTAANQAAGLRNDAPGLKAFADGKAAADGLEAALLARVGFTAQPTAIDGRQGMVALHGGDRTRVDFTDLGRHWSTIGVRVTSRAVEDLHSALHELIDRGAGETPRRKHQVLASDRTAQHLVRLGSALFAASRGDTPPDGSASTIAIRIDDAVEAGSLRLLEDGPTGHAGDVTQVRPHERPSEATYENTAVGEPAQRASTALTALLALAD